jgi:hypothetical protein
MDKKEIAALLLSSAVIGALFSSVITAIAQWRERVARQKELVLKVSIELAKTYVDRISGVSGKFASVPDLFVVSVMYEIVKELFEDGSVSTENQNRLKEIANIKVG